MQYRTQILEHSAGTGALPSGSARGCEEHGVVCMTGSCCHVNLPQQGPFWTTCHERLCLMWCSPGSRTDRNTNGSSESPPGRGWCWGLYLPADRRPRDRGTALQRGPGWSPDLASVTLVGSLV